MSAIAKLKVARIYIRVSTEEQDFLRQEKIKEDAKAAGYYIAGVYREKASGARMDRPELLRLIDDLQPGEVVVAEKIDRISRLPLPEAEKLIEAIKSKGARLSVPDVIDLSELSANTGGVTKIVLEAMQAMLLKLALQMARDDYETRRERQMQGIKLAQDAGKYKGRTPDLKKQEQIVAFRKSGNGISVTAKLVGCSISQVKRIWNLHLHKKILTN